MAEIIHNDLVLKIEAAITAAKISKSTFGILATNDPCLFGDLLKGRELRSSTILRVQDTLKEISLGSSQ